MQIKTPPKEGSSKPSRPERLGDYELLAELARDPIGMISAARSVSGQGAYDVVDVVALRSIQPSSYIDAWLVEDICQAAWGVKGQILSHVLPVTDVIVSDGRVGVVSDYSEGEYLRSLLRLASTRKIPFPVGVALRITVDVLMGLNSIQQAIGRKPELSKLLCGGLTADRLLVGSSGEAEVAEVVLSGRVTAKPLLGYDDDGLGYHAPEHFAPDGEPDVRADLFVVGIVLHEMLANRGLFMSGDLKGQAAKGFDAPTVQNVLKGPIEKVSGSSIPAGLAEVLEKALNRDLAERFQTPLQFKDAIEGAAKSSIGTTADVARFVEQVAGQVLSSRKSLIHRALRLSDPGGMVASPAPGAIKVVMPEAGAKADDAPSSSKDAGSKPAAQESPKPPASADKTSAKAEESKPDPAAKPGAGKAARPGSVGGPPRPKATLLGMPALDPALAKQVAGKAPDDLKAADADKVADKGKSADDDKAADKPAAKPAKPVGKPAPKDDGDAKGAFGAGGVSAFEEPKITDAGGEEGREPLSTMDLEEVEAAAAFAPAPIKLPDAETADEGAAGDNDETEVEPDAEASPDDKEPKKRAAAAMAEDAEDLAPKKSKSLIWAGIGGAALLIIVVVIFATRGDKTSETTAPASATASASAVATATASAPAETASAAATAIATASAPAETAEPAVKTPPPPTATAAKEAKATPVSDTSKSTPTAAANTGTKKPPATKPPSKKFKPTGI
jgi:hypothetical protein